MDTALPPLEPYVIRTYSGHMLDLQNPSPEHITIEDICIGLSRRYRFAAQTMQPYTVAQHCVNASSMADKQYKLAALMHDASEAYLGDVPSPIKIMIPDFKAIELNLMRVIGDKFGFALDFPNLKEIDNELLKHEWSTVMIKNTQIVWESDHALWRFAITFENLTKKTVVKNIFNYDENTRPTSRYPRKA